MVLRLGLLLGCLLLGVGVLSLSLGVGAGGCFCGLFWVVGYCFGFLVCELGCLVLPYVDLSVWWCFLLFLVSVGLGFVSCGFSAGLFVVWFVFFRGVLVSWCVLCFCGVLWFSGEGAGYLLGFGTHFDLEVGVFLAVWAVFRLSCAGALVLGTFCLGAGCGCFGGFAVPEFVMWIVAVMSGFFFWLFLGGCTVGGVTW